MRAPIQTAKAYAAPHGPEVLTLGLALPVVLSTRYGPRRAFKRYSLGIL